MKSLKIGIFFSVLALFFLSRCSENKTSTQPNETQNTGQTAIQSSIPLPTKTLLQSYMSWAEPPKMTIDTKKIYIVDMKTEKGNVVIQLFADKAPKNVNNFIFLINQKYYNGLSFHRVVSDFIAQAGKPPVARLYGPGYSIKDEHDTSLRFDAPGVVAMAWWGNSPDSNGSQFFITYKKMHWYNDKYTIIGKVVEGMDVIKNLTRVNDRENYDYGGDTILEMTSRTSETSLLPAPGPQTETRIPVLVDGRPLAKMTIQEKEYLYDAPPAMVIDKTKVYKAKISTEKGTITADLFPQDAPQSVNNFFVLANIGYYDNTTVGAVLRDRYILVGSPSGTLESDAGYSIPEEPKRQIRLGAIGFWFYAKMDRSSSGSNIFIMLTDDPHIQADSVFGMTTSGLDVVKKMQPKDKILKIEVVAK